MGVFVAGRVVAHRLGEATLHLQPVIRPLHQFADGMGGKELAGDPIPGRFEGERLGPVFAKFQSLPADRVGKGATGAFETARLVHRQKRARSLGDDALLHEDFRGSPRGSPTASRAAIRPISRFIATHRTSLRGRTPAQFRLVPRRRGRRNAVRLGDPNRQISWGAGSGQIYPFSAPERVAGG